MAFDDLKAPDDDSPTKNRDRWIGVYIGVLAVLLAICSMGGDNASKEATLRNIEASNIWAFFQAKNVRRQVIRTHTEELEIMLATMPSLGDAPRKMLQDKIASNKAFDAKLTSDPQSNEGLDELFKSGKAIEAMRNHAMAQDPYFDYGQALLQIAIVLASIVIIAGGSSLLVLSGGLGVLGTLSMINGFLLLVELPFIG